MSVLVVLLLHQVTVLPVATVEIRSSEAALLTAVAEVPLLPLSMVEAVVQLLVGI